ILSARQSGSDESKFLAGASLREFHYVHRSIVMVRCMNSSSPTHLAFPTRRWSAALALSLTLMLAACATGATPDEKTPAPSADMSTATLLLAGESITFELQFCSIDDTD